VLEVLLWFEALSALSCGFYFLIKILIKKKFVFCLLIGSGRVYPIGPDYFKRVKRVVSGYPFIFVS
jgi:hypothetical protein